MNSFTKPTLTAIFFALILIGLQSCENGKERFEDPPWLGGSSIETLKEKGNYTIFLALMEKAKYKEPISKQLFTLFVPSDDAFKNYFASIGKNSVDDLNEDEAIELFTLHILRNPRSRFQLIYEYLYNELQGPDGEYASLFFRKPTVSTAFPYRETSRYIPGFPDSMWIYTDIRLIPLFSKDYFEDFFGDVNGGDYEFMFPGVKWPDTGLSWGPAAVTEQEVRTADGFIYYIERVVPPQPNLEKYLKDHQDKYGIFYDMMQRFANYNKSKIDENNRILYRKTYDLVPDIAEEQGPSTGSEMRQKDMFTLFLPNDEVFKNYLNNSFLKSYESIDSLPQITMSYLVQAQISRSLGLLSKFSKSYFNSFGDQFTIQKEDILSSAICSNGVIYETNKFFEPDVFTCVPGMLFYNKNYSTFLLMIDKSNLLSKLTDLTQDVTLFAASNDQIDEYGIRYDKEQDAIMQYLDGEWTKMKDEDLSTFIQDHIHIGKVTDLSGEGYLEMSSKSYIHYKNNRIEAGGNVRNNKTSNILDKIENKRNGMLFTIDEPILTNYKMGDYIYNQPEFSEFSNMLVKAGLLDPKYVDQTTKETIPNLKFLGASDSWTAFIPTNAAIASAKSAGLIPNISDLPNFRKFLQYHFVKTGTIFDDGKQSGDFETLRSEGITSSGTVYSKLTINNTLDNLQVTDHVGNTVTLSRQNANALVKNGVVHKINSILRYQ